FGDCGSGGRVVGERGQPRRRELAPAALDEVVVLRVHLDQQAGRSGALHQAVDREVVDVEDRALVGRVDLGAADAAVDDALQLGFPAGVQVRDVQVKRVVDVRTAVGSL